MHSHQDHTTIAAFILALLTSVAILVLEQHGISKKYIETMVALIAVRCFRFLIFLCVSSCVYGILIFLNVALECFASVFVTFFGAHHTSTKISLSQKISDRLVSMAFAIIFNGIVYLVIRTVLALPELL